MAVLEEGGKRLTHSATIILSVYYTLNTVLGSEDTAVSQTDEVSAPMVFMLQTIWGNSSPGKEKAMAEAQKLERAWPVRGIGAAKTVRRAVLE